MMNNIRARQLFLTGLTVAAGSFVLSMPASGYSYGPLSDAEWAGWPEFCKVRYTVSGEGRNSLYASAYPAEVAMLWEDRFSDCWGLLHHHCGALLQLQRARSAIRQQDRRAALDAAIQENNFALNACPVATPFYSVIVTHLGMTFAEQGDRAKAEQQFDRAIIAHPDYDGAYVAKAAFLRKRGASDAALTVLLQGSEATDGRSAALENALGLAYFDAKNFEKARDHARRAYSLGYPLPALRDKLVRAGFPL